MHARAPTQTQPLSETLNQVMLPSSNRKRISSPTPFASPAKDHTTSKMDPASLLPCPSPPAKRMLRLHHDDRVTDDDEYVRPAPRAHARASPAARPMWRPARSASTATGLAADCDCAAGTTSLGPRHDVSAPASACLPASRGRASSFDNGSSHASTYQPRSPFFCASAATTSTSSSSSSLDVPHFPFPSPPPTTSHSGAAPCTTTSATSSTGPTLSVSSTACKSPSPRRVSRGLSFSSPHRAHTATPITTPLASMTSASSLDLGAVASASSSMDMRCDDDDDEDDEEEGRGSDAEATAMDTVVAAHGHACMHAQQHSSHHHHHHHQQPHRHVSTGSSRSSWQPEDPFSSASSTRRNSLTSPNMLSGARQATLDLPQRTATASAPTTPPRPLLLHRRTSSTASPTAQAGAHQGQQASPSAHGKPTLSRPKPRFNLPTSPSMPSSPSLSPRHHARLMLPTSPSSCPTTPEPKSRRFSLLERRRERAMSWTENGRRPCMSPDLMRTGSLQLNVPVSDINAVHNDEDTRVDNMRGDRVDALFDAALAVGEEEAAKQLDASFSKDDA
ncbi:hypothetical protein PTSG_04624 [Salpingoeca rosetta]|uniref:Uncharacterized protein n=1 Tax=Salpingoeca rosetta (strain ATCC 50818 / BSB-021) TaxID=946362 RepID=F2U7Z0_SALR5|nr:uncharacterized protein PTSG_04624 [Salpingoeca rosetta]EGD72895.1 hypothetical protein PTSG_04624 [Salpingoeca rosetta]|eukprot:XP_004994717.1 hypothetical protein PTSG_04624 [Salpingoeca rosetta]